ncbi:MAG TPA: hypothetical protein VIE65_20975 [Methylobacter sp.]
MINQPVGKVVNIISVIDGIAFRTNIFTLNAAVDVRNLVQRTVAGEIKSLIGDSEDGSKLVARTRKIMKEIVSAGSGGTIIKPEIRAASIEQKSGIEQVNQASTKMGNAAQQNSALVEQAPGFNDGQSEIASSCSLAAVIGRKFN